MALKLFIKIIKSCREDGSNTSPVGYWTVFLGQYIVSCQDKYKDCRANYNKVKRICATNLNADLRTLLLMIGEELNEGHTKYDRARPNIIFCHSNRHFYRLGKE